MSGNAKLFCNFKFNYLFSRFDIFDNLSIIEKLSKNNLLDLIFKGVLQKYSDILDTVSSYYYNSINEEYIDVYGLDLINLWKNNKLIEDNYDNLSSEEIISRFDWRIKNDIKYAFYFYITGVIHSYYRTKIKIVRQKQILSENTLFLKLDKVFYLYKCIENLNIVKK